MIDQLLALPANLWDAWSHVGHKPVSPLAGSDGSCPTCDFPFGDMAHMCLTSGKHLAS
jgi:hypothetical protein